MFRLLSKKTNLFSVPTYIGALLLFILISNDLEVKFSNIFSSIIVFVGLALGYILFNKISLNRKTHLPLFLYSIFIFSFYNGNLDVGISMALFTSSILLFFFTNEDDRIRKDSFYFRNYSYHHQIRQNISKYFPAYFGMFYGNFWIFMSDVSA